MWCPLKTGIVASQCPLSRDAARMIRYLRPLRFGCLNWVKAILTQWKNVYNDSTNFLESSTVYLPSMGQQISLKWWQPLAWMVWCYASAFVIHGIDVISHQNAHSRVMIYHHLLGKDVIEWFNHNTCERSVLIDKYNHNKPCALTKLQM